MFIPVELSAFSRWIFTNSLKASVLIFLILFIQWLVRDRLPSKWMYVLWLVLVIRLLLPAGFESGFSLYNFFKPFVMMKTAEIPAAKPESVSVYLTDSTPVAFNHRAEISPTGKSQPVHPLTKAWIAGAMTVALLAIAGNVRFWLRIKNRRPVKNPVWLLCMDECRKQMHIKQRVRLACSDAIRIPMLYGIFRPVILLPGAQNNKWTKDQLRHIFCHELAHLKRFDIPMACLTSVLQILHWFNPLLWIAFYRIRLVREMACDAIALNYLGREQARSYGATILAMLENISTESLLPMTVGIVESKRNLKKRMISIARFKQPRLVWTVLGLLVVLLTGGTVLTEARNHLAVGGAEVDDPAVLNETLSRNVRTSQTESTAVELNGPAKVTGIKKSHTHISGPIAANLSLTGDSAEVPGQKQHSATDVSPSALQKSFRQLEQSVSVEDKPQILRPISENGLYGYADSTGKVCIKPQFQMAMGFYENIAPVKKDGKWGYIDRKGNWVVNPELEAANQFGEGGLAEIKKEGKWGYINSGGEVSIEPQFENAYPFTEGLAVVQKNGKYGFIDAAGHVVVDFKYDRSNCFWNGLAAVDKNGKWGFIDSAGGLVIPCEYEKAEFFSEGLAAVQKNGRFGYIDVKNEFVIPLQFEAADHFSEGLAAVKPVGQKYGFIDKSGKIVIKPQYDVVLIPFEDGRAWVTIFENPEQGVEAQSLWIDPAGKVIESAGPKQKETKSGFHLQIKRNSIEFNGEKMGLKELRNILSVRYAEYVSRLKQPRDQKDIIGGGAVSVDIDDAVPMKQVYTVMNALAEIMPIAPFDLYTLPANADMTLAEYRAKSEREKAERSEQDRYRQPQPVDGWRRFYAQIPYPKAANKAGWMGRIYAIGQLNSSGRVIKIDFPYRQENENQYGCYDAVEQAVRNTEWLPGKMPDGQAVKGLVEINALFPSQQWCLEPGENDIQGRALLGNISETDRYVRVPYHHLVKNSEKLTLHGRELKRSVDYELDDVMTLRVADDLVIEPGDRIEFRFLYR